MSKIEKIIEKDVAFSTEGCSIYSAKVELMDKHIVGISKARTLLSLEDNKFIDSISISAWEVEIEQFNSSMDDEDREEIEYGEFDYFQFDCAVIIVSEFSVTFRAFNKWDSAEYFEINLDE